MTDRNLRIVVAGVTDGSVCGVRDHATTLSAAMVDVGAHVSMAWAPRAAGTSPRLKALADGVALRCREERADAVLLHYSVFAFSRHGVPTGVPMLAARLQRLGVPIVLFAHEFVYPWGRRGWRGAMHALTQRVALLPLVLASRAVVVATSEREQYLCTRRWLPRRPVATAPVFSNIRPCGDTAKAMPGRIGLLSFGADAVAIELVTGAVAEAHRRHPEAHLVLIGSPGPASVVAERWRQAAGRAGCPLTFTGVEDVAEVSGRLSSCDLVLFPDPSGPTSRKTSLAAALAHGKPVIALDGPQTWQDLRKADAVIMVRADERELTAAICRLLDDAEARAVLGARARDFYAASLSPQRTADTVLRMIAGCIERLGVESPHPAALRARH